MKEEVKFQKAAFRARASGSRSHCEHRPSNGRGLGVPEHAWKGQGNGVPQGWRNTGRG